MPKIPINYHGKALIRLGLCSKPGYYSKNDLEIMLDLPYNDLDEYVISDDSGDLTLYNEDGSEYCIFRYDANDDVYQSITYELYDLLVIIEDFYDLVQCENCKEKKEINIDIIYHQNKYLCHNCISSN